MYQNRMSKEKVRNHFYYDKWKYVLGIVLTIFSWSMLATITAPRTPADKKVDIYLVGGYMLEEEASAYSKTVLADFPELMEVNIINIALEGEMEYAGRQKLMVMVGSQSGDMYAFTKEEFVGMANMGAFLPLDEYPELLGLFTEEELKEGTFATEDDPTERIYGVPVSKVEPIGKTFFNTENMLMGVMAYSQNSEKAIEVLQWIIEHKGMDQYDLKVKEFQKLQEQQAN